MPSSIQVYTDTSANILALTPSTVAAGSLLYASDTNVLYMCNGTAIQPLSNSLATISKASVGMTAKGNLNPTFTPTKNSAILIGAQLSVTTYSSGTLGVQVTYNKATVGTQASQSDVLMMITSVGFSTHQYLNVTTAGASKGIFKTIPVIIYASGGKVVQLKTSGNFSGAYTAAWEIIQLSGP